MAVIATATMPAPASRERSSAVGCGMVSASPSGARETIVRLASHRQGGRVRHMSRRAHLVVGLWPWLLSLAICAPLLAPGYVLTYDMVWVPDLTVHRDTWGLGTALPRAVPSDLVVAVVDEVIPGQIVQKLIILAALGLAGTGAARLCVGRGPVAALAAARLSVWNPFVAERLGLGHWPLLVGYAALPWIVVAGRRLREGTWSAWSALTLGLAASAISPVGGVLGLLVGLASQVGGEAESRRRRLGL